MFSRSTKILSLIALVAVMSAAAVSAASTDKVLLSEVKALTLHANQQTNARRGYPIPQLTCVGSRQLCADRYKPTTVQCYNVGSDGADAQWRCEAELDSDVAFDTVEVSCEGYYAPEDEYVLKGSCGLEYRLKYTNAYKDRQAASGRPKQSYTHTTGSTASISSEEGDGGLFKFFLLCAVGILLFAWVSGGRRNRAPIQTAPPMNDFVPPSSYTATPSTGPGFGAGVAVGAIGGAAAAHLLNRHSQPTTSSYEPSYNAHRAPDSYPGYPSQDTRDSPPTTHKSTGYGGSKKR